MKALVYEGPKNIKIKHVKDPVPNKGEVLIKVKATGICGSDVHGYLGITGRRTPPMIMGHEFSGDILEIGQGVTEFNIGDRVTVQPLIFCGVCKYCQQGLTNLCINKKFYGAMDTNGSMAEFISAPQKLIYKLPPSINYLEGAMIEPLAVAYRAVNQVANTEGENVFIVGAGTIGLLVLQIVKSKSPSKIFISDIDDNCLELAKKMGADFTINPIKDNLIDIINRETKNEGIDTAFEVVGIPATVQQAMSVLKKKGTCVWVGNLEKMINLNMQEIVTKELNIGGTYSYTHIQFGDSIKFLVEKDLDLDSIISKVVPLEEGPAMFEKLAEGKSSLIKVILTG
ncbi:MAG: galactitol-1-phosphate 5-dehydrogenase [Actinobacteria bacterium]|nr:galactitol-1-phosphate 5-dehydrogenase [Actinomycetota bacterium]